jgi:hypothetical protein
MWPETPTLNLKLYKDLLMIDWFSLSHLLQTGLKLL